MNKRRNAFTLVEILVVLAIIAILAAILFPAFNRAKENARQANCASNLQQIGFAVLQYRKDEGRYPDSLVDILGEGVKVADMDKKTPDIAPRSDYYQLDGRATGYLKGGQSILVCPDDDTLSVTTSGARSSYGYLSKNTPTIKPTDPISTSSADDLSQLVWNYWGYRDDGFSYLGFADTSTKTAGTCTPLNPQTNPCRNFLDPTKLYSLSNPIKYSMSNRFASSTTIITHCIYHRLPTGNSVNFPGDLYGVAPTDSANTKDIVLRIDGSAKAVDVSQWKPAASATTTDNLWQKQTS